MTQKKGKFKLSKFNWLFGLAVITFSIFIFLRKDGINSYSVGYAIGTIITTGIIPLVFAFIVWLIKGKKPYAGTYTFNIVLILLCIGSIREIGTRSLKRTDSISAIKKSTLEYKKKINNDEDVTEAYKEHIGNVNDEISKIIKNSSGNEQEVYKNLQKFTVVNNSIMLEWQNAYDSVMLPRILDYSILNNQEEFNYQIKTLKQYKKQSQSYKNHFEKRKSIIVALNKSIPKDNQTLLGIMKGIDTKDSIQKPIFKPYINSHIKYADDLIELVEFLESNKGKWEYKNEELVFKSSSIEDEYLQMINKISEDESLINELTDKLIEVM